MEHIHQKIIDPKEKVILYELIPPCLNTSVESQNAYVNCAIDLLQSTHTKIDAINIPEIRQEESQTKQSESENYVPKIEARAFASSLKSHINNKIFNVIVNHCTVYNSLEQEKKWLKETYEKFGIDTMILVGGNTSLKSYPGPSVNDMSSIITEHYNSHILCGGIVIPSRRKKEERCDEPYRMLQKSQAGIQFFTSQVIYSHDSVTKLLFDYDVLCKKTNTQPKKIFLSFAPISSKKDLLFLRWLGVEVPDQIEQYLFESELGTGWRSIKISLHFFQQIINFVHAHHLNIPLGLNIEHITRHNFELSREFIEYLGEFYLGSKVD